jgi:hypothetical protein
MTPHRFRTQKKSRRLNKRKRTQRTKRTKRTKRTQRTRSIKRRRTWAGTKLLFNPAVTSALKNECWARSG